MLPPRSGSRPAAPPPSPRSRRESPTSCPAARRSPPRQGIPDTLPRRRLIRYLTAADMKKRGSDTILGNLWWILDPLLQLVVYVILVAGLSRGKGIPDYPRFIFVAIIPWKWFNAVTTDATTSVMRAEKL